MPRDIEQEDIGPDTTPDADPGSLAVTQVGAEHTEKMRTVLIDEKLRLKKEDLVTSFQDYVHTRKIFDAGVETGRYDIQAYALSVLQKDPEAVKQGVERLIEKSKFGDAGDIALAIGDDELSRKVLAACVESDKPHSVAMIAAKFGDIEPIRSNFKRWATSKYYPSSKVVHDMAMTLAEQDLPLLKSTITEMLNKTSGTYAEREMVSDIVCVVVTKDHAFGKRIMEDDLAKEYGGSHARKIAIVTGDTETARKLVDKFIKKHNPRMAAEMASLLGDEEINQKVLKEAARYSPGTAGEAGLLIGNLEVAKHDVLACIARRAEKIKAGEYNANSTDSGENNEKKGAELMIQIAERDPDYGKEIIEQYFRGVDALPADQQAYATGADNKSFANGVPSRAVEQIGIFLAEHDPDFSRKTAERLRSIGNSIAADRIIAEIFQKNFPKIKLTESEAQKLLETGRDQTALAVGWALAPAELQRILPHVTSQTMARSAKLGGIFNKTATQYERELSDIAFSTPNDPSFNRSLSRCLVYFDYDQVSNILLQKVKDAADENMAARYLKTLVEMENPKGRTMATDLFANREIDPHLRRYLAKKLLAEKHWDPELTPLLQKSIAEGNEAAVDDTLVAMIKDLGLVPDRASYEVLEKPGILTGATLKERVNELKSLREEFSKLTLTELKEKLKDERIRKIFYLVKGGEYRYTLINNYSYEKFSLVVSKMLEQVTDDASLTKFDTAMEKGGIQPDARAFVLKAMNEGRFPFQNADDRSFSFDASIELGSEYEIASERLQEIWGQELYVLAAAQEDDAETPIGIEAALATLEGKDVKGAKTLRILEGLKQGVKQDFQSMKKLADACKKEMTSMLRSKMKQTGGKGDEQAKLDELERLNISGIFHLYLSERFPKLKGSSLLREWESHVRDVLTTLETGPVKGGSKKKKLELTFLDKGKDFIRATRFADGRQCCFNSNNYNMEGGTSAADWIARLHADPLSFVMDIKESGSRIVSGFVFGRMGIDPKTGRPVVMLNGIYSQDSGATMNNNILKLIEEKFARTIGASSIDIASKHGGKLSQKPDGYKEVKRDIEAVRALKGSTTVYDDIGVVANGNFSFEGYERELA